MRTPLNGRLSLDEHQAMIGKIGAATLIYGPSQAERAAALKAALPGLAVYGLGDGEVGPDLLAARRATRPDADPRLDARARRRHPRLVHLGHDRHAQGGRSTPMRPMRAVVHNVLTNLIDPKPGEIMLHAASMIHASGSFVLPYWLRGGTAAILPGFSPASYIEAIERWRPTALNLVPTMLQMLFQLPGIERGRSLARSRRSSTAPRRCRGRCSSGRSACWGPVFVQYYGQTEAPLAICRLAQGGPCRTPRPSGCSPAAGRASRCEIRLVDEDGRGRAGRASRARSCCARPS